MNYPTNIQKVDTNLVLAKVNTIVSEIYCVRTDDLIDGLTPIIEEVIALLLESNQIVQDDLDKFNLIADSKIDNYDTELTEFLTTFQLDSVKTSFKLLQEKMIPYNELQKVLKGFQFILNTLEQTGFTIFDVFEKVVIIQQINFLSSLIKESQQTSVYDYFLLLNKKTPFIQTNEIVPNQFI